MKRFSLLPTAACALALLLVSAQARANPHDPQVMHGRASFSHPDARTLQITNDPDTIIEWQGFSIQRDEITRFVQPSSQSAVLNRVVGGDLSEILGQLSSNGRVFLINPHGIVFGPDAVVDTAGFTASTLNMTDEDFLRGNLHFEGGPESGAIHNQGLITASAGGDVHLIAPEIENSGVVRTDGGDLVLAAGRSVTIAGAGRDQVLFEVQAPEDRVLNLGKLLADGGAVGAFAGTLTHAGEIRADAVNRDETGAVVLTASRDLTVEAGSLVRADGPRGGSVHIESDSGDAVVQGRVSATGGSGPGGTIHVLGERVALWGGAGLDASGGTGGGEVLVGGDFQGQGDLHRSRQTVMGPDATIQANARTSGDGGKVVVWSDGATRAHGAIEARGGSQSGDGGLVEASGKENLAFDARVDTRAPAGKAGTVLLDPATLTIVSATSASHDGQLPEIFYDDDISTDYVVSDQALEDLPSGDVYIEADGLVTINDLGDPLDMSNVTDGYRFTISSRSSGGIQFVDSNDTIETGGGEIWLTAYGAGDLTNIGNLTVQGPTSEGTQNVYLFSEGGSIDLVGSIDVGGPGTPYPGVTLEADSIAVDPASQISSETLFFYPSTFGLTIDVGGPDGPGVLGIENHELNGHDVWVIEIGRGVIDVTSPINFATFPNKWFVLRSTGMLRTLPGASITTSDTIGLQGSEIDLLSGAGTLNANIFRIEAQNGQPLSIGNLTTPMLDIDSTDLAALNGNTLSISTWWNNGQPLEVAAPTTIPAGFTNVVLRQNGGSSDIAINASLSASAPITLDSNASIHINTPVTAPQITLRPHAAGEAVLATDLTGNVTLEQGTLRGTGTVSGDLTLNANTTLAPGASPGTLNVNGNLFFNPTSTLLAELGGTGQGSTYDWINVGGTTDLDGTLDVTLWGGFTPSGETFDIMSYGGLGPGIDFAAKNFPAGYGFAGTDNGLGTLYQLTTVTPPPASPSSEPAPDAPPSSPSGGSGVPDPDPSAPVDPLLTLTSGTPSGPGGAGAGGGGAGGPRGGSPPAGPGGDGLIPASIEGYSEPERDEKNKPCITCK